MSHELETIEGWRAIESEYLDDESLEEHIELIAEDINRRSRNAGK